MAHRDVSKAQAIAALLEREAEKARPICPPGTGPVWGEGSLDAAIALVGEAPGAQEAREHRPFVGPAGEIFNRQMSEVGIHREDCWITASMKCRPTLISPSGNVVNRRPTDAEIYEWRPFLLEELSIIRPAAIICLGAVGAQSLLGKRLAVNKERGKWFDGPMGIPLILTFHPSYLRRATASGKKERERLFRLDVQEAMHVSGMR